MTNRSLRVVPALIGAVLIAGPLGAQAPTTSPAPSHLLDHIQVSVSGTVLRFATNWRVDRSNGTPGTDVDPEDDLGMPATVLQGRFGLRLKVNRRSELEFGYLLARRGGEHVLADTIVVGDTSFAAGLRLQSDMASDNATLTYRFAFHVRERQEFGATASLGALLFRGDIKAIAGTTSGGPDTTVAPYASSQSLTVPTAAIGLYGRWQLGRPWYIEADLRGLYFSLERVTVHIIDAGVAGRYFVNPWLGIEAGYAYSRVSADIAPRRGGKGFAGRIQYGLHNARLGLVATRK